MIFMPARLRAAAERMSVEARSELERRWTIAGCPARAAAGSRKLRVILGLWDARRISPLSGWPWLYCAWVTIGLGALDGAMRARGATDE